MPTGQGFDWRGPRGPRVCMCVRGALGPGPGRSAASRLAPSIIATCEVGSAAPRSASLATLLFSATRPCRGAFPERRYALPLVHPLLEGRPLCLTAMRGSATPTPCRPIVWPRVEAIISQAATPLGQRVAWPPLGRGAGRGRGAPGGAQSRYRLCEPRRDAVGLVAAHAVTAFVLREPLRRPRCLSGAPLPRALCAAVGMNSE